MNVFVSWSGELSKNIAEILRKKIPCIIQSADLFVSSSDIEKGEGWPARISSELSVAKFGIVCLTPDNIGAPWVHFEAGAISKALDTRVTALMININPSDIQGPLKLFQATKLDKQDFFSLLKSINGVMDTPAKDEVLVESFEMAWDSIKAGIDNAISTYSLKTSSKKSPPKAEENPPAIEEILSLVRKQASLLSAPEQLIPPRYLYKVVNDALDNNFEKSRHPEPYEPLISVITDFSRWAESFLGATKIISIFNSNNELFSFIDLKEIDSLFGRILGDPRITLPNSLREKIKEIKREIGSQIKESNKSQSSRISTAFLNEQKT